MSYRKSHIKNKVGKMSSRWLILTRPLFWIIILSAIIVFTVIYFVVFFSGFQLDNIIISGNNKVKTQDLQTIISNNISTGLVSFYDFKLSTNSIFLVNTEKIKKQILDSFPEIEKVTAVKKLPRTLIFDLVERKPIGVFCTPEDDCFFIDNNGIIFESLMLSKATDFTIVRQILDERQVFVGEKVVYQNIINAINALSTTLKNNFKISLSEVLITSPIRMDVKTSESWKIYFDLGPTSNIDDQIVKINSFLSSGISAENRKNLRYIDLRAKDRAVVCDNSVCAGN